jgi:hypothetical protein
MNGILIKPDEMTVEAVEFDGSLDQLYALLKCDMIEIVNLDGRDTIMIIDETGRIFPRGLGRFAIGTDDYAGYGLICCMSGEDIKGTPLGVSQVKPLVEWLPATIQ